MFRSNSSYSTAKNGESSNSKRLISPIPKSPYRSSLEMYRNNLLSQRDRDKYEHMFDLFDNKADVKILDSAEDDRLAASAYGATTKRTKQRRRPKKPKKGISGYDFDALIGTNDKDLDDSTDHSSSYYHNDIDNSYSSCSFSDKSS